MQLTFPDLLMHMCWPQAVRHDRCSIMCTMEAGLVSLLHLIRVLRPGHCLGGCFDSERELGSPQLQEISRLCCVGVCVALERQAALITSAGELPCLCHHRDLVHENMLPPQVWCRPSQQRHLRRSETRQPPLPTPLFRRPSVSTVMPRPASPRCTRPRSSRMLFTRASATSRSAPTSTSATSPPPAAPS